MDPLELLEKFAIDFIAVFGFAVVAIIALLIGYKIFDKMTPKCNFEEELTRGNVAVAAVLAGYFIALAAIIAAIAHALL
jgi:uncharacterized membrane protein YjfL (UPF0719 family)